MAFAWFKKRKKDSTGNTPDVEAITVETIPEDPLIREDEESASPLGETPAEVLASGAVDEKKDDVVSREEQVSEKEIQREEKPVEKSGGFFQKLKKGLSKTRKILTTDIDKLFVGSRKFDDEMIEELEELLITSDIGVQTTMEIIENISKKTSRIVTAEDLKAALREELLMLLSRASEKEAGGEVKPRVVMVIGVNGVGKTTTIGKIAARATSEGKKVLIAAADTFRAAAVEQLGIWAQRAGAELVRHKDNADPGAVAYDGVAAAIARDMDVVYVDTAGRLHTKTNLMEELKKIKRSISKKLPDAPHEILLVLDATTGQNALSQASLFGDAIGITGIVLTKLDGTAKGGIVVSICNTLGAPLKYIGVGESIDDLQDFDPVAFVNALL